MSNLSVSFEFSFCGEKTIFTHVLQQTNEQTLTTSKKKIESTYKYFPCHLPTA